MFRAFVEARAPATFNLFSSACRRRSISPASAEINSLNLDEPDIANVLLHNQVSRSGNVGSTPFVPCVPWLQDNCPGHNDYPRQKFLNLVGDSSVYSSPSIRCVLGVPRLTPRTCRVAVRIAKAYAWPR